jgi:hypothetical protein
VATNITIDETTTNVSISGVTETTPAYTTITLSNEQGAQGPTGATGATGPANTLSIGTVAGGVSASATITGTAPTQTLNLVLPKGDTGDTGPTGQGFLWRGAWATGTVYATYDVVRQDGSSYRCSTAHTSGSTTQPGIGASWTGYWSLMAEKGDTGNVGDVGTAATIAVGTVTTGAAGSSTTVTNSGSSSVATFDFSIPQGNTGATGQGYTARGVYSSGTTYAAYDVVFYNGQSYRCKLASTGNNPLNTTYWELFAAGYGTPIAYNASDTYYPGDTVTRLGSTYYCIATVTGAAPPNATYWILIASKGDTGAVGSTGATGAGIAGRAHIVTTRTKATSNAIPEAVFWDINNTAPVYFPVAANKTYFFEGVIQFNKVATANTRMSIIYQDTSGSVLTEQGARLLFRPMASGATPHTVGGGTAANTNVDNSTTTNTTVYIQFQGWIKTHATTAGKLNIGLCNDAASTPSYGNSSYINIWDIGTASENTFGGWS